jgi:hypothetical protein
MLSNMASRPRDLSRGSAASKRIAELAVLLGHGFPASSLATELIEQASESQYRIEQVRKLKAEAFERGLISGSHPFAGDPWEESWAAGARLAAPRALRTTRLQPTTVGVSGACSVEPTFPARVTLNYGTAIPHAHHSPSDGPGHSRDVQSHLKLAI